MSKKMRYCTYCGDEMGVFDSQYYEPTDTCGKPECERYAREAAKAEREEAHRDLDDRMGWQ